MIRKANFTAGPAVLPDEVECKLRRATVDFANTGLPVWSVSHRSSVVEKMCTESASLVKELLNVPDGYSVLFLPGGATAQFKAWYLNVSNGRVCKIGYVHSGHWSGEAIKAARELEARNFCSMRILASSEKDAFRTMPCLAGLPAHDDCDFVHITTNETVNGTQMPLANIPQSGRCIWVADMTSDILTRPFDVSDFGLIYAGAQKNLGIAGATLVIVRDDLVEGWHKVLPAPLSYAEQKRCSGGLRNTADVLALCAANLMLRWIKELGGVIEMERRSRERAALLYRAIDKSFLFEAVTPWHDRSPMNVIFRLREKSEHDRFLTFCDDRGLVGLKGHVGAEKLCGPHLRASLYNGQTIENVERLIETMKLYERASP